MAYSSDQIVSTHALARSCVGVVLAEDGTRHAIPVHQKEVGTASPTGAVHVAIAGLALASSSD